MTKFLQTSRAIQGSFLNESVAAQVVNAADAYLVGSQIAPSSALPVRSHLLWKGSMTKTAAGVAAPSFKIRVGNAGTIADTVRATLTPGGAQTAVADVGCFEIYAILRAVGATAILDCMLKLNHDLAATGFADRASPVVRVTSAAFDLAALTTPYFGLSVDPGAAAVWTFEQVVSELKLT